METVFGKNWFGKHQGKLLWLLNFLLTRRLFRLCLGIKCPLRINKITPSSISYGARMLGNGEIEVKTDFNTDDKYSNRLYSNFKLLWYLLHFLDWSVLDRVEELSRLSFGFSTLTVYPDGGTLTISGGAGRSSVDENLATIRAGAGNTTGAANARIRATNGTGVGQYQLLNRYFMTFDTSSLTAGATITATVLSLAGVANNSNGLGSDTLQIVSSSPASNNAIVNADYSQRGTTSFGSITYAGFNAAGSVYNDITLDVNGRANVSKTGVSKFAAILGWDFNNSFTGVYVDNASTQYSFDNTASGNFGPKLTVTYTVPSNGFLLVF